MQFTKCFKLILLSISGKYELLILYPPICIILGCIKDSDTFSLYGTFAKF